MRSAVKAFSLAQQRCRASTSRGRPPTKLFAVKSESYSSTMSKHTPVPRAAVSIVVRHHNSNKETVPSYLLIERGNPPNAGVWCVPGGKIEMGEKTLEAAKRELEEEVKFVDDMNEIELGWYTGAFCTSDSIVQGDPETGKTGYHYLIAQCFAEVLVDSQRSSTQKEPPRVKPADDAQAARWWTLEEIKKAEAKKETVPNLAIVIERAESLYQVGMLPTTHTMNIPTTASTTQVDKK